MKQSDNRTMILKLTKKLKFTAFILIFLTAAVSPTYSQSVTRLIAMPPRVEDLSAQPGEVVTKQIKVKNSGSTEMVIRPETQDFLVKNKKGRPTFIDKEVTEHENRWAMSRWMTVSPAQFVLQPGETKKLDLIIVVPEDAIAGGHYAGVIYQPDSQSTVGDTSGSKVNPKVAALVYLTVEGDITENARVTRLEIPSFSEFGPIDVETEITNYSGIHITPNASINIYNHFNKLKKNITLDKQNIFPSQARIYENTWDQKWLLGRFKAELTGSYGSRGQALQAVTYFWVVPWKVILAALLAIILIIITVIFIKKKSDSRKVPDEDLTPEE